MLSNRVSRAVRWPILAIVLVAMNLAAAAWALKSRPTAGPPSSSTFSPGVTYVEANDGSLLRITYYARTGALNVTVLRPATWWGLWRVWAPIVASGIVTLLILALVSTNGGRQLIRGERLPRITMLQGMAAIGLISIWLWLYRFNAGLTLIGSIVLSLMAHAAWRRGALAKEIKSKETTAPFLSRAGIVGYTLVALLALAWLICIYLWDVFKDYEQQLRG